MMMWGWGGPFMWFGGLMWFVPVLIIGLIIWAFSGSRRGGAYGHHHAHGGVYGQDGSEALEVLKMRLAKGEITEEEYGRLKDVLK